MFVTTRITALAAVLFLGLTAQTGRAEIFTLDLPELTGTFVHGQAPISAFFNYGLGFTSVNDMTLSITATGLPGSDINTNHIPAELLGSVDANGMNQLDPTVFGPYGAVADTQEATFILDRGLAGDLYVGAFDVSGEVVIDTNDIYPGVTVFPEVQITAVTLTVDGQLCTGGDLNCDGFVGIAELNIVLGNWNLNVPPADPLADSSGDGYVGIEDLSAVLGAWNAGTPPITVSDTSDQDSDACFPEDPLCGGGFFGIAELNRVLAYWNQSSPPADPLADWSGDGYIGIEDLNWVLSRWNAGTPPTSQARSAVPEPGALALLGVLGLLPLRRRWSG
jgi:MYXO-CTERM domain-containing protein